MFITTICNINIVALQYQFQIAYFSWVDIVDPQYQFDGQPWEVYVSRLWTSRLKRSTGAGSAG